MTCNAGFQPSTMFGGATALTCGASGRWSSHAATCQPGSGGGTTAPSPAAAGVPTSDCYHVPDFARKYSCALPAYDWQSCAQRLQRQGQDATFLIGYYFSQQHCTCLPAKYVDPACGGEAGNAAAPKFTTLAECQARCHVAAGCPSVCSAVCFD